MKLMTLAFVTDYLRHSGLDTARGYAKANNPSERRLWGVVAGRGSQLKNGHKLDIVRATHKSVAPYIMRAHTLPRSPKPIGDAEEKGLLNILGAKPTHTERPSQKTVLGAVPLYATNIYR